MVANVVTAEVEVDTAEVFGNWNPVTSDEAAVLAAKDTGRVLVAGIEVVAAGNAVPTDKPSFDKSKG